MLAQIYYIYRQPLMVYLVSQCDHSVIIKEVTLIFVCGICLQMKKNLSFNENSISSVHEYPSEKIMIQDNPRVSSMFKKFREVFEQLSVLAQLLQEYKATIQIPGMPSCIPTQSSRFGYCESKNHNLNSRLYSSHELRYFHIKVDKIVETTLLIPHILGIEINIII